MLLEVRVYAWSGGPSLAVRGTKLKLLETRRHGFVLVRYARLAFAPLPIVLADAPPSALLALAPYPSVLADASPSALLALAP